MRSRLMKNALRTASLTVAILGFLLAFAGSLSAHHSFYTMYLEDKQITLQGTLDHVVYRNPHSYVYLLVSDRNNQVRLWVVECGSPDQMRRQRLAIDALKPGDQVVVTGSPGRDPGDYRLRLRTIARPPA
jgi:Family of unknown function (DUF6152)